MVNSKLRINNSSSRAPNAFGAWRSPTLRDCFAGLAMTVMLSFVFFLIPIATPALAACDCVCTGCDAVRIPLSNQTDCNAHCSGGRENCSGAVCTELGGSNTPATSAPEIPETGAAAVTGRLQNIAVRGVGFPEVSAATLAGGIVRAALVLLGVIFLTLTIYGGSLYLTAGGNEEQVKKAKSVLIRAAIGLVIVLFAGAITQFITGYLNRTVVVQ